MRTKAPSGRLFRNIRVVLTAASVLALATPVVTKQGATIKWKNLNKEATRLWIAGEYGRGEKGTGGRRKT